ncbi:di-heme oxidoredictase family protein [Rhodocaloribacter sp.]
MKTGNVIAAACLALTVGGCEVFLPEAPASETVLAEPMEGLTSSQRATHVAGDESFARVFGVEDGLGPVFVAASCEGCHAGDGKGHPLTTLTRFGRYVDGVWDPMRASGGPQLQHRAVPGYTPETLPASATGVTRLMPPAITGLGLLEAVEDDALLAFADPDDADGDGISGVPNWILPPDYLGEMSGRIQKDGRYIGRFGKKAGAINLLHQIVTAYREDMGITSDFAPEEIFNVAEGPFTGDDVPDPEVSPDEVRNVVFYVRTLKAPPRRDAEAPDVQAGEALFEAVGCAACHRPTLRTGPSDVAALHNRVIHPYTDLLLHDMGPDLDDGYTEGTASTAEWRTAPLWGLGLARDSQGGRPFFLHDGRAESLEEAIRFHGGEAAPSRDAFFRLSPEEQGQVIQFLNSL